MSNKKSTKASSRNPSSRTASRKKAPARKKSSKKGRKPHGQTKMSSSKKAIKRKAQPKKKGAKKREDKKHPAKKSSKNKVSRKKSSSHRTAKKSAAKTARKSRPARREQARKRSGKDPYARREAGMYDSPIASREYIIEVIHEYGAANFDALASHFGYSDEDRLVALRRRLGAMQREGQLVLNRRDGYITVDEADLVRGRVTGHPDGYGFLIPEEGDEDVYLHASQMRTLLHGDRAVAQVTGVDRRGRREGRIVSVFERAHQQVVGRLFIENGISYVQPDNKRITQDILIESDALNGAVHGQIVVARITSQPTFKKRPMGQIAEIIGEHMAPGMEIDIAIRSHGIPHEWPAAVTREVADLTSEVQSKDKRNRVDIRDLPLVTIDGEDAKDFDDAVYCESTKSGWKLLVAIADVSHYVSPGCELDNEALERATSVYFPGRVVPMLPEVLSNGLCSINPRVDRLCLVCEMNVDNQGELGSYRFFDGLMQSHARLTYTQVAAMLIDKDKSLCKKYKKLLPHLKELYELYGALKKQRKLRGAIDFETTETSIIFDENKKIERIDPVVRNEAHKIIEECMISANICAARFLEKHKMPALFRNHEGPSDEKLLDLRETLSKKGLSVGRKGEDISALDYAALVASIRERDDFELIQILLLRSLKQAIYTASCNGHFGLALEQYAHFTSPIRRYPDLLVHRAIRFVINKGKTSDYLYSMLRMSELGEHCSTNERRADDASREAVQALKCEYMLDKIGNKYDGVISGVTGFGVFVALKEVFVEGLVHITNLPKDYYEFDPGAFTLRGERNGRVFRVGDEVSVTVSNVSLDERKIDFDFSG